MKPRRSFLLATFSACLFCVTPIAAAIGATHASMSSNARDFGAVPLKKGDNYIRVAPNCGTACATKPKPQTKRRG